MGISPLFRRNMSCKVSADSFDCCSTGKSYASGYPEHVSVHGNYRFAVNYGCNNVGSFASHSGQFYKFIRIGRHLTIEITHQHCCHGDYVTAFAAGVRNGPHQFI